MELTHGNNYNRIEVLAPAGSLEICKAVINAGADAVYLGGDMFGARAYAGNLNNEEMLEALDYAHRAGRRIYLTVNTLLKHKEIEGQLISYIRPFYEHGLDAVIVQDLGVMRLIKKHFPDMDIHASTQMTQTGSLGAKLLWDMGAERVVTSREMTLTEIAQLHKDCPDMEIESFVHGAMCYCYSGQCLMSSFRGGRSGNRGRCAQPCRLSYKVYDNDSQINDKDNSFALSPKDMCALPILPDIIEAGVYSLKIEGRMKNVTYAAYVTSVYRHYVDEYIKYGRKGYKVTKKDIDNLCDIYNRGSFTTGFYNSKKGKEMMSYERPNHRGSEALKVVSNDKGRVTFKALKDINPQDVFEIDKEHSFESGSFVKAGNTLVVNLPRKYNLYKDRIINRMKNSFLERLVKEKYVQTSFERDIDMYMEAVKGSPLSLTAVTGQFSASISGSEVTKALKQPADYEDVKSKLTMTGNTGYKVSGIELHMDNDVFLSVGELKKLRREVIALLDNNILSSYCRTYKEPDDSILNPCCMTHNEQDNSILSSDCDTHNEHNKNCAGIEGRYNNVPDNAGKMLCTVYCHSFDIVRSVLDIVSSPDNKLDIAVGRIYLDFGMYYSDQQRFIKACEEINKTGIKLFIALPYILEQSRVRQLSAMLDDIEHNTGTIIDGYLVRNIEEIGLIGSRNSKAKDIITDTGLYVFNKYAGYELKDIADKAGVRLLSHTLPLELNNSELQDTLTAGSEIIVYGKIPAMVSKSCVRKTYGICDKKCSTTLLKQGSDVSYIVESVCSYCYTVTWAGTFDLTEELKRNDLGVRSLRFEFIDEDTFTIKKALSFEGVSPYKGHFYRGVN